MRALRSEGSRAALLFVWVMQQRERYSNLTCYNIQSGARNNRRLLCVNRICMIKKMYQLQSNGPIIDPCGTPEKDLKPEKHAVLSLM